MWKRTDIDPGKRYRLGLRQSDARRHFVLLEDGSEADRDCVLETAVVPNDLLLARDFEGIASAVPLTTGQRFFVDAHGIWLTEEELAAMRSGLSFAKIPWVTGKAPRFAPK